MIIHRGTNNVGQNLPKDIASGIMKLGKIFTKKHSQINIITSMIPGEKQHTKSGMQEPLQTRSMNKKTSKSRAIWY